MDYEARFVQKFGLQLVSKFQIEPHVIGVYSDDESLSCASLCCHSAVLSTGTEVVV